MVGDANHHETVELGVFKGEFVDVAGTGLDFVAVDVLGLGEFGFAVVKNDDFAGTLEVFVG